MASDIPRWVPTSLYLVTNERAMSALRAFIAERDWAQFHSPENLAKSIAIEAGELLEEFQWSPEFDRDRVRLELADVLTYCYELADQLGVEPEDIILEKLEITRAKYPVEKTHGRSARYDRL
jgi:NTP pyrophosphatase (non-canonical NTP hydrolase)